MAIQQHPVPQDISNYKFRLIGDMTIKQFASLGISIVLSIIVYSFPLPFFFKYPISFFLLALGVGMAFVPVQGRTLDVWIIAFIKSIYSPTQYVWKQVTDIQSVSPPTSTPETKTENIAPTAPVVNITPPTVMEEVVLPVTETPISTPETKTENIAPTAPVVNITPPTVMEEVVLPVTETPISTPQPTMPNTDTTHTEPTVIKEITPESSIEIPEPNIQNPEPQTITDNANLPIPFTPSNPNTLVGLSLTSDNHILDGVLIEIKQENLTIRATKSNKLGQFLFARPLENGLYQILAEKEGFVFNTYSIELKGEIIKPLKIQAEKK